MAREGQGLVATVKRGKALVAALRAQPGVRDAEALAGWLGKKKRLRQAAKNASKNGSSDKSKKRIFAPKVDDDPFDDPFSDDSDAPKSKEEKQREKYEQRQIREQEKAERSRLYQNILEVGGLKTRDELREEYAGIPNTYKRRDGLPGDEMAEYLNTYYPEYGIETEDDLIQFLAA